MTNLDALGELSNDEFIELLLRSLPTKSWTFAELSEHESRDDGYLNGHEELRVAINETLGELQSEIQNQLGPQLKALSELAKSFGGKVPQFPKLELGSGGLSDFTQRHPELAEKPFTRQSVPAIVDDYVEAVMANKRWLPVIAENTRWRVRDTIGLTAAIIAAVGVVWQLFEMYF